MMQVRDDLLGAKMWTNADLLRERKAAELRGYARGVADSAKAVAGARLIGSGPIGPLYDAGWNSCVLEITERLTTLTSIAGGVK